MPKNGKHIFNKMVLLLLEAIFLKMIAKSLFNSFGVLWSSYQKKNLTETMLKLNHLPKIIRLFFMEEWSNMLDIPNHNGNWDKFANLFFKLYGRRMILNLHSMGFVSWMVEENTDREKMMHFYMLISPQQKILYGAIKE